MGSGQGRKKTALVSWKTICNNKYKGSLGIKDIRSFNKALMGK